jgi:hypothetical protein
VDFHTQCSHALVSLQVTDSPQVHSNGFHICFDLAADATLGYILPTWLEPHQRAAAGTRTL